MRLLADDRTGETRDVKPDIVLEITFPQYSLAILKAYAAGNYWSPSCTPTACARRPCCIQAGRPAGHEGTSYLPLDGESGTAFDQRFGSGGIRQSQWDGHVYDGHFLTALAP